MFRSNTQRSRVPPRAQEEGTAGWREAVEAPGLDSLVSSPSREAGEMAQGLRALVSCPENPSSVPSPHVGQLTVTCNHTRSRESNTTFWPLKASTHTYDRYRNKNKIFKSCVCYMALIVSKMDLIVPLPTF